MTNLPTIGKPQTLHTGPFLSLVTVAATFPSGHKTDWAYATRGLSTPCAVRIIAMLPADEESEARLVLNREFRIPTQQWEWSFPAGLCEEGEDPLEVAARELKEETGLEVASVIGVSPIQTSSAGMTDETSLTVVVEAKGVISNDHHEDSECIETHLYSPLELRELLAQPEAYWNGNTWPTAWSFAYHNSLPLQPQGAIYAVTALRLVEDNITDSRTFGWFPCMEQGLHAIQTNAGSMEECLYTHIILERNDSGIHGPSETVAWFLWDTQDGLWQTSTCPEALEGVCNYGLG